jgi:cysteinyl-tRNA synthetase
MVSHSEAHNCSEHNAWVDTWIHLGHLHIEGRKMSKSLKNFISIEDYLSAQLTSAPADDFRLYCLQHKYHATLTYSTSRVEEASKLRGRFENFFSSVRTALNTCNIPAKAGQVWSEDVRRRPTSESTKLTMLLSAAQEQVRVALGDDFNTPVVLNALSHLVGEALPYANLVLAAPVQSEEGLAIPLRAQPIEPLISVSAYVARILTLLGLQFPASNVSVISVMASDAPAGADAKATGASTEAVDTVVQFRSTVRTSALQGIKALRAKKKAGVLTELEGLLEVQLEEILAASDASREGLGRSFGIKIDDVGGTSKWTKV